jgi:GNAT superfamily N-acetyltransferase
VKIRIVLEDAPARVDLDAVERGLIEDAAGEGVAPREQQMLSLFARDVAGRVVGGLVGDTVWGWLQVKQLWVAPAHRRNGYGKGLLEAAEREARRRGCHGAVLDTFDFQARGFYEALGYVLFGSLDDFPRGHARSFMRKTL